MAATTEVWCLLIDPKNIPIGCPIKVAARNILDFKEKFKEKFFITLKDTDVKQLAVWHCKEPKLSADAREGQLEALIKGINFFDESKVVEPTSPTLVQNLGLSEYEMLLVQVTADAFQRPAWAQTSMPKNAGGIPTCTTGNGKRSREDDTATGNDEPNKRQRRVREGDGGVDALEEAGYEVESALEEVSVFSHGTFERLPELPPHIYCVRRKGGTSGTGEEYVAKRIRRGSSELEILLNLGRIGAGARCDNIIPLLDVVSSSSESGSFIVLPKLRTISSELDRPYGSGGALTGRYIALSRDLANGLTFLHSHGIAHLDINPSNLVYTSTYQLQIIDFDIFVRVEGEVTQIDRFLGTEGWMAPEIGEKDGRGRKRMYSPMKADRWSCGRVFLAFAVRHTGEDEGLQLREFAERLVGSDPDCRPRLSEWCEPHAGAGEG